MENGKTAQGRGVKRIHLIISGDVQGVGYRTWAKQIAHQLNLNGWVINRPDGAVEVVAEGTKAKLEEFIRYCRKGPEVAWIQDVAVTWQDGTGEFVSFDIKS